jgi:HSP20 family protein
MTFKDLIPWTRGRGVSVPRGEELNPFYSLHREMNRLFDEAFRGFDLTPFEREGWMERPFGSHEGGAGWPRVEVGESETEWKVTAELPGLEEKDVEVELAPGVLVIKGEKRTETGDTRWFSERFYGRFARRIPFEDIEADQVAATFKNGVLTVTLPKSASARENVRRIAINSAHPQKTIEHRKAA